MSKLPGRDGQDVINDLFSTSTSSLNEQEEGHCERADGIPPFHAMARPFDLQPPSSPATSIRSSSQESLNNLVPAVPMFFHGEVAHYHLPSSAVSHASDAQRSDLATVCSGSVVYDDIEVESVHSHQDRLPAALAGATLSSPSPPTDYVATAATASVPSQSQRHSGTSLFDSWHTAASETNGRNRLPPTPARNTEGRESYKRRASLKSVASNSSRGGGAKVTDAAIRSEKVAGGFEEVASSSFAAASKWEGGDPSTVSRQVAPSLTSNRPWRQRSQQEDYDPRQQRLQDERRRREDPAASRGRSRSRSRSPSSKTGR